MDASKVRAIISKIKKPLFLSVVFALLFFLILFPTGDLGDLVSTKVSELTQNQVFLQFNNFSFSLTPPGVEFSDVFVETIFTSGISAEDISISPSISGLISQKPYGSVNAKGLLNGSLNIAVKKGQPTEAGAERQRVLIDVEQMSLSSLRELMKWSLPLEGSLSLSADGQAEVALAEQPEVELNLNLEKFFLPPATVNTQMGPLTLPDMKLGEVRLKGRLSSGKFNIDNAEIGKKQDELHGKIKGFWNISFTNAGGRPVPQFGSYNFEVDLVATKMFQTKASLFLSLLDQYKTAASDGARYHFKVSAADLLSPPSISEAR
jgi:type II secretion system protein N